MDSPFEGLLLSKKEQESLQEAGLPSSQALLDYLPKRYEDRRSFDQRPLLEEGRDMCLKGIITDFRQRQHGRPNKFIEAVFVIQGQELSLGGRIGLRWFNMPYIGNMIAVGMKVILYGRIKESRSGFVIDHPEFEVIQEDGENSIHIDRIVPIYKNIKGISQRRLREIFWEICCKLPDLSPRDFLIPDYPISRANLLHTVHFPQEVAEAETARRSFALEEFFLLQLNVLWEKKKIKQNAGISQGSRTKLLKEFYHTLPFDLTNAQKRSIKEVIKDLRSPQPMHRLLQGDVGSGKTFVAICAMLLAVDSGYQTALMAPTQILAEQHYLTVKKWLAPLGVRIRLKTGSRDELSYYDATSEDAQIIIGTHALLYDKVKFDKLSLVIIDEQHRFGVEQRRKLIQQSSIAPDVLVMTATPIPRTLTLSIYGDLDVSLIDELPPGRQKIVSAVRCKPKVSEVTKFLKDHISEGRQAYLVYPLVEESENLKAGSVITEHEKWAKRLKPYQVELLHGKLKGEEKDAIMQRFHSGESAALVSTTVIEVGVDVPNANIMLIYDAERFGLAQLHQLRGRVGRGQHKSYCVLISNAKDKQSLEKLSILAKTSDGFALAEADLTMRGPGEVLGTSQSGLKKFKYIEFFTDQKLIYEARYNAEIVLEKDPNLSKFSHLKPYLKSLDEGLDIN